MLITYFQAFSFGHVYEYYKGTKCKPWDNRELDALDGIRANAFVLYTMSQTAICVILTVLINVFGLVTLLRNFFLNIVVSANLALELFIFISVFLGFYKSMQIMDAKKGILSP